MDYHQLYIICYKLLIQSYWLSRMIKHRNILKHRSIMSNKTAGLQHYIFGSSIESDTEDHSGNILYPR
jgi:hypothetical protein